MSKMPRVAASKDERGATAILVAVMALVLMGVGAMAVDLGQVYAKRSSLQKTVDLATLAAAAQLDGSNTCSAASIKAATDYLKANWIDQAGDPITVNLGGSKNDAAGDGYMECKGYKVYLEAPKATVKAGLARAVGFDSDIKVPAQAAAGVYSPEGAGVMPAYAVSGCDYGPQTLLDDSPGGSTPLPTPQLAEDSPVDASLSITTLTPDKIALNQTGTIKLTIDGNNALKDVQFVAFTTPQGGSNIHHEVAASTAVMKEATVANIPAVPVRSTQEVWYVRVSKDGIKWSNALPFQVGDALLQCESTVTDGNFGALILYRNPDPSTNDRLALNMAKGLDFTLAKYPGAAPGWECTSAAPSIISVKGNLKDGTNCVDTDTGLPANATESGLLTGEGISAPGRLAKPTSPGCGSNVSINFGGSIGSRSINNDHLDCFLDAGVVGTAYQGSGYTGPAVLSADIFYSPRFFWVPVFGKQTGSGGSKKYQIVTFRPGFITGPDSPSTDEYNGLGLKSAGGSKKTLRSVKVVFFNANALPASISGGPTTDYLGVGTRVINLTD